MEDEKRLTRETEALATKGASHEHRDNCIDTLIEMGSTKCPCRVLPAK